MMENTKLAKVHYNEKEDKFELWLQDEETKEWGFSCSVKCVAKEGGEEANFIHFSFLRKVLECIALGYKVIER